MKKSKVPVDKVFYKGDNNITYKIIKMDAMKQNPEQIVKGK